MNFKFREKTPPPFTIHNDSNLFTTNSELELILTPICILYYSYLPYPNILSYTNLIYGPRRIFLTIFAWVQNFFVKFFFYIIYKVIKFEISSIHTTKMRVKNTRGMGGCIWPPLLITNWVKETYLSLCCVDHWRSNSFCCLTAAAAASA